jgi:hypothetical protein
VSYRLTRWPFLIAEQPEKARRELNAALRKADNRAHVAAKALGLSRDSFRRYCAKLGIGEGVKVGAAAHSDAK